MAPFTKGAGVVFMLHRVRPEPPEPFEPNRILKVTPKFLEEVIGEVIDGGIRYRLARRGGAPAPEGAGERPFACFTLDDGYRDNRDYAYPVFKKLGAPFAIYMPAAFADGRGDLWWLVLEAALRKLPHVSLEMNDDICRFELGTPAEKDHAFHVIYWWLRSLPETGGARHRRRLLRTRRDTIRRGSAQISSCRGPSFASLRRDPLVTIGAHTLNHFALAKLPAARRAGRDRGERASGSRRSSGGRAATSATPTATRRAQANASFRWRRSLVSRRR